MEGLFSLALGVVLGLIYWWVKDQYRIYREKQNAWNAFEAMNMDIERAEYPLEDGD